MKNKFSAQGMDPNDSRKAQVHEDERMKKLRNFVMGMLSGASNQETKVLSIVIDKIEGFIYDDNNPEVQS